jgi:hypothetical protein
VQWAGRVMRKISNICTEFKQLLAELENAYCGIDSLVLPS